MQSLIPSAVASIKKLMGLTDKQAVTLMPGGDNSPLGFPGVIVDGREDDTSWAQREYDKDHKGWQRTP
jgi:hypothetical protein